VIRVAVSPRSIPILWRAAPQHDDERSPDEQESSFISGKTQLFQSPRLGMRSSPSFAPESTPFPTVPDLCGLIIPRLGHYDCFTIPDCPVLVLAPDDVIDIV
jgi:hypothetical protein